jgi:SAM-dependent methyltransferase
MLKFLYQIPFLRRLYFDRLGLWWIKKKVSPFIEHLPKKAKIVDIGSGNGLICYYLRKQGFNVTPLDVVDMAYNETVRPVVYDGREMPFEDNSFDYALILTVLHHIDSPEEVLNETCRIAQNIVIIEDIYTNAFQKYLTFFMDWLVNLGYSPTPHTNKDDFGWKSTFNNQQLELKYTSQWRVLLFFRQVLYIVKK